MKKYLAVAAILVAIIAATLIRPDAGETPLLHPEATAEPTTAPIAVAPSPIASALPSAPRPTPARATPNPRTTGSPLSKELNAPNSDATRDLAVLHEILRQYLRLLRQRPGHPIGNDSDLARVLTGRNPMKLVFLPPTHPALTPDGRLRDRWGTPYFIHPRGNGAFEIRSAGIDRQLFTADDAIENPPPGRTEAVEAALLGDVSEP